MADILDAAQTTTPPPNPTPAEPLPPHVDSLIVPPPEIPAPVPVSEPPPEKPASPAGGPKKKSRLGVLLAGLLLLVITLPILTIFVKQQVEIRSRASTSGGSCTTTGGWAGKCVLRTNCKSFLPHIVLDTTKCLDLPPFNGTYYGCCAAEPGYECKAPNTCLHYNSCLTEEDKSGGVCPISQEICCKPTPTPACIKDGSCVRLTEGETCCSGKSYLDSSCGIYSKCGIKPAPTSTPTPTPTPTPFLCASPNKCVLLGDCEANGTIVGGKCVTGGYVCCKLNPCIKDGSCVRLTEGETCCSGKSYLDSSCGIYSKCGIKPAPTSTPTPIPGTPTPTPGACNLPPNGYICPKTGFPFKGQCAIYHCPQGCGTDSKCDEADPGVWISHADCSTKLGANECGQIDIVDEKLTYCDTPLYCTVPQLRCTGCTITTPKPTPTPPPGQCVNIIAYKDGNALSQDELNALHPGDMITLAFAPGGAATKVRFRVNAGTWNVTTTKNQNSQFTWNYTLADVTNFVIEAQWFNGTIWQ